MKRRYFTAVAALGGAAALLPAASQAQVTDLNDAINKAGRQRMLSQRMAKRWSDCKAAASTTEMNKARDEFIAAHDLLKKAPEATPAIKAELVLAEAQFGFFDTALRTLRSGAPDTSHMTNVFTTSERILQVMDGVTGMYSKLS
ncbi:MAG: type IV pili methyl-accepting chemotaxis transducer N-terminal domain-containing protein [Burkholderiaceae bacterium]